jgi:hypothetical protein
MAESLSALARGITDIGEAAATGVVATMAVDIMDAGSETAGVMMAGAVVGSTAVTDFMVAEGSAAVTGFKVAADSAGAQAAGFTVVVDSAAVQAEGFMVEADSTAVAGVTAADTAK